MLYKINKSNCLKFRIWSNLRKAKLRFKFSFKDDEWISPLCKHTFFLWLLALVFPQSLNQYPHTMLFSALRNSTKSSIRAYTTAAASSTTRKAKKYEASLYNFGKYAYYDAIVDIKDLNVVHDDSVYISRQKERYAKEAEAAPAAEKK